MTREWPREWLRAADRAVRAMTGVALRRSGPVQRLSRRNWLFDIGLALGLALLAILTAERDDATDVYGQRSPFPSGDPVHPLDPAGPPVEVHTSAPWALALLLLLIAAPLVFRRRYPLSVLWVVLVTAAFVDEEAQHPLRLSFYVCVIAAYSAAVYSPYRVPALASLPVAALLYQQLQADAAEPSPFGGAIDAVPQGAIPYLILLPIAVAAYGLRSWRSRADAEEARASALEQAVRRAAEEERARIARELHDVVTHNVSVMVIQAGAARKVLDAAPEQAREALLAVEASGRAAMTELRHVMGLLTMEGEEPELAPQPGLAELESLVDRVRDAGLPVELIVTGQRDAVLPDGVDLAGYRVAQEALTNAVKHAAGASAVVRVDYGADRLWIEVADTGGRARTSDGSDPDRADSDRDGGRGLIGLRERLAVYGGTLHAGPRIRGGYRVEAVIPFEPTEATDALDVMGTR